MTLPCGRGSGRLRKRTGGVGALGSLCGCDGVFSYTSQFLRTVVNDREHRKFLLCLTHVMSTPI